MLSKKSFEEFRIEKSVIFNTVISLLVCLRIRHTFVFLDVCHFLRKNKHWNVFKLLLHIYTQYRYWVFSKRYLFISVSQLYHFVDTLKESMRVNAFCVLFLKLYYAIAICSCLTLSFLIFMIQSYD